MSTGCLSCFNIICFRKKHGNKQHKSVKAEDVVEPVVLEDDEEESPDKKTNTVWTSGYIEPDYLSTNSGFYGKLGEGDSSSSLKNDFNKVKTFDLRGVTTTKEK
ncbi:hypothetical protein BRARA_B00975 [Brassica rapa]|uniref:Uncharacterized protein n=1 Tax=Brassica campestris TaxID=3711 RepID=A0A398A7U5_BRACM|nr:hypothetical protein BRARA_B00975 [Brassica rapa]CAG7892095.1 unnamed protein product [Brassica rapa]VDC86128.1 unnamed protein product [Brassica rapa]